MKEVKISSKPNTLIYHSENEAYYPELIQTKKKQK